MRSSAPREQAGIECAFLPPVQAAPPRTPRPGVLRSSPKCGTIQTNRENGGTMTRSRAKQVHSASIFRLQTAIRCLEKGDVKGALRWTGWAVVNFNINAGKK